MENDLRKSITQDILKYLEQQEALNFDGEGEELHASDSVPGIVRVQSILRELVNNVADRAQLIEDFQTRLKAHNQYPLFDLADKIPNFFIDEQLYEKLAFHETLTISYVNSNLKKSQPVGGLCLDVQLAKGKNPLQRRNKVLEYEFVDLFQKNAKLANYNISNTLLGKSESEQELAKFKTFLRSPYDDRNDSKFLIHVSSKFEVEGQLAGSRITTWLDRNFHTLEEKRSEYVFEEGGVLNEKSLYCAVQPRRYYLKHQSAKENLSERKYYSMEKTRDLVCEGANFVLMRYLAITRYIGEFELSTMYINGDMCRNIYECQGPESDIVNEVKIDICKVYRTVLEECGIIHKCVTILTLNGDLVRQKWDDSDYVVHINPLVYVSNDRIHTSNKLMLSKTWKDDIQLFSNYLDSQTTLCMELKSYLNDHSEFKNIISDYVQATLLMKPEDILDFSIKYFKKYYPT